MIANCDPDGKGVITREAFIRFNKKKKFDWSHMYHFEQIQI